MSKPRITITDGAYVVEGNVPLYLDAIVESEDGTHLEYRRVRDYPTSSTYLLCRCGRSSTKPFCDYRHMTDSPIFEGPETANRAPYSERAKTIEGNGLRMHDDGRCAFARLCHFNGKTVWEMARESDGELKLEQVRSAWHCPTGRLAIEDQLTGEAYEQEFEPSIVVLEDSGIGCSGPLFVRGGIELVGQDGFVYETRNRYALCRCGKSTDMPFCDASHHHEECFEDGCAFDDGGVPEPGDFIGASGTAADAACPYDESFARQPENL